MIKWLINRFTADHALPDNKLAQEAMLLTFYHWGLHAWAIYTIVGLLLGLMAHRYFKENGKEGKTVNGTETERIWICG